MGSYLVVVMLPLFFRVRFRLSSSECRVHQVLALTVIREERESYEKSQLEENAQLRANGMRKMETTTKGVTYWPTTMSESSQDGKQSE